MQLPNSFVAVGVLMTALSVMNDPKIEMEQDVILTELSEKSKFSKIEIQNMSVNIKKFMRNFES